MTLFRILSLFFLISITSINIYACQGTFDKSDTNKIRLIFHFTFDENNKYKDKTVVNSVNRESFKVNYGTKIKNLRNYSLLFTGNPSQGIDLGVLDFAQPVTIAFWIKQSSSPIIDSNYNAPEYKQEYKQEKGRIISAYGSDRSKHIGSLRISPAQLEVWQDSKWAILIPGPLPTHEWSHIAVTFNKECQATGYFNGLQQKTIQSCFDFGENTVVLCSVSQNKYGFPFAGLIDDVRIYKGILKRKNIERLAKQKPD